MYYDEKEVINLDKNFNLCNLVEYLDIVKGLSNNSSSPTDTWIIEFKNNITFEDVPIKYGFLKIFIDTAFSVTKTPSKLALNYELNIYNTIINKLVLYNICPNFLECLATGNRCSFEDLLRILKGKVYNLSYTRILTDEECEKNLNRNIYFMVNEVRKRPPIQSNDSMPIDKVIDYSKWPYKYNMILLENMEGNITLNKWLFRHSMDRDHTEFYNILFQVAVACYAMSLSKMVHNDLHSNNIFIKDLGIDTYFLYNINDTKKVIRTRYQALIYDFDRAYQETLGDNEILKAHSICNKGSQCNIFVENKDIIKIMCYVYNMVDKKYIKDNIIKIVSKETTNGSLLKNTYDITIEKDGVKKKECFLQYIDDDGLKTAVPLEWYNNYNDTLNVVQKIGSELPNYVVELVNSANKVFNCNKDFFNEDGTLNILKATEAKLNTEQDFNFNRKDTSLKESNEDFDLSEIENLSDPPLFALDLGRSKSSKKKRSKRKSSKRKSSKKKSSKKKSKKKRKSKKRKSIKKKRKSRR